MRFKASKVVLRWIKMGLSIAFETLKHHCTQQTRMKCVCTKIVLPNDEHGAQVFSYALD